MVWKRARPAIFVTQPVAKSAIARLRKVGTVRVNPDAARIIGRPSREIEGILGYPGRTEMIHRDDMVMVQS